jgi:hypothetical protein
MADPLSIIAGTVGICDVCYRVYQYLKIIKEASGSIKGELEGLQHELSSLQNVNKALETIYTARTFAQEHGGYWRSQEARKDEVDLLWNDVKVSREGCKEAVEDLQRLLEEKFMPLIKRVIKNGEAKVTSTIDGIRKQLRWQAKSEDLGRYRLRLANFQGRLQVLLTALNM